MTNTIKNLSTRIVRAILAMSNLPDGGYVIIGVEKDGNESYVPTGMTEAEAGTYEYDKVLETCNLFADPYVSIEIKILQYDTKKLVAIHVFEFVEMPVICKGAAMTASSNLGVYMCDHSENPKALQILHRTS